MAKKKRKTRRQGLVSWATSLISLGIGLAPVWANLSNMLRGQELKTTLDNLDRHYNILRGDTESLKIGYGALVGGVLFKTAAAILVRKARVQGLLPKI
jgi:hypothetical protein